jgi:hypothetical protein
MRKEQKKKHCVWLKKPVKQKLNASRRRLKLRRSERRKRRNDWKLSAKLSVSKKH